MKKDDLIKKLASDIEFIRSNKIFRPNQERFGTKIDLGGGWFAKAYVQNRTGSVTDSYTEQYRIGIKFKFEKPNLQISNNGETNTFGNRGTQHLESSDYVYLETEEDKLSSYFSKNMQKRFSMIDSSTYGYMLTDVDYTQDISEKIEPEFASIFETFYNYLKSNQSMTTVNENNKSTFKDTITTLPEFKKTTGFNESSGNRAVINRSKINESVGERVVDSFADSLKSINDYNSFLETLGEHDIYSVDGNDDYILKEYIVDFMLKNDSISINEFEDFFNKKSIGKQIRNHEIRDMNTSPSVRIYEVVRGDKSALNTLKKLLVIYKNGLPYRVSKKFMGSKGDKFLNLSNPDAKKVVDIVFDVSNPRKNQVGDFITLVGFNLVQNFNKSAELQEYSIEKGIEYMKKIGLSISELKSKKNVNNFKWNFNRVNDSTEEEMMYYLNKKINNDTIGIRDINESNKLFGGKMKKVNGRFSENKKRFNEAKDVKPDVIIKEWSDFLGMNTKLFNEIGKWFSIGSAMDVEVKIPRNSDIKQALTSVLDQIDSRLNNEIENALNSAKLTSDEYDQMNEELENTYMDETVSVDSRIHPTSLMLEFQEFHDGGGSIKEFGYQMIEQVKKDLGL